MPVIINEMEAEVELPETGPETESMSADSVGEMEQELLAAVRLAELRRQRLEVD